MFAMTVVYFGHIIQQLSIYFFCLYIRFDWLTGQVLTLARVREIAASTTDNLDWDKCSLHLSFPGHVRRRVLAAFAKKVTNCARRAATIDLNV